MLGTPGPDEGQCGPYPLPYEAYVTTKKTGQRTGGTNYMSTEPD